MAKEKEKKIANSIVIAVVALIIGVMGGVFLDGAKKIEIAEFFRQRNNSVKIEETETGLVIDKRQISEESIVIDVVETASPSVVTIGIKKTQQVITDPFSGFFDPFGFFGGRPNFQVEEQQIEQDIGTGFVISKDGLIVTNKHVVSDGQAEYSVISKDDIEYKVEKIYRDPILDLAILQTEVRDISPLALGDSDKLKVGQTVIAIGTALGEFRNTVTTGVISGLGRGIVAGGLGQSSERLENVIQTDAAINPGNSGGPLLNSGGQVIGVSVATSSGADNISFAIPINVVREAIENFYETGKFERAYLGVQYKMVSRDLAILNEIPEGAYLALVMENSPASKAGLRQGDIITKIDGQNFSDIEGGLAEIIRNKKVGDRMEIEYFRDNEKKTVRVTLEASQN